MNVNIVTQKRFSIAFFLTSLSIGINLSCSSVKTLVGDVKPVDQPDETVTVPMLEAIFPEWKFLPNEPGTTNAAWQSNRSGSLISFNSSCREKSAGNFDLRELAYSLTSSFSDQKVKSEQTVIVDQASGLEITVTGIVQSQKKLIQVVVLKSDLCIYDLIYLGREKDFKNESSVFKIFRDKLKLK